MFECDIEQEQVVLYRKNKDIEKCEIKRKGLLLNFISNR